MARSFSGFVVILILFGAVGAFLYYARDSRVPALAPSELNSAPGETNGRTLSLAVQLEAIAARRNILSAIGLYFTETGRYPASLAELVQSGLLEERYAESPYIIYSSGFSNAEVCFTFLPSSGSETKCKSFTR